MSGETHYQQVPLKITIEGVDGPCGKTLMQFLLAEFLSGKGHNVLMADVTTEPDILLKTINWYHRGHYQSHMNTDPVEVRLSVTTPDTPVRADEEWIQWRDGERLRFPSAMRRILDIPESSQG